MTQTQLSFLIKWALVHTRIAEDKEQQAYEEGNEIGAARFHGEAVAFERIRIILQSYLKEGNK